MIDLSKEVTRLITNNAKKVGYSSTYYDDECHDNDDSSQPMKPQQEKSNLVRALSRYVTWQTMVWTVVAVALLVVGVRVRVGIFALQEPRDGSTCRFCDQSPPVLHEDESYTIEIPDKDGDETTTVTVTPMTVSYEYELHDGENLFTMARSEIIPNLGFDYAVVGLTGFRNVHGVDGTPVSLDEVYVHHFSLFPLNMLGAEVLARGSSSSDEDYLRFPPGYALHILADEKPYLRTNAHLISNKNLQPIGGSIARAHKECNECYYGPGKGSECTPEVSGTFLCCGDADVCATGEEFCACATTTASSSEPTTTTSYRIELDLLIAKEVDKFTRVEQWNLAAPSCSVNMEGNPVFEEYPPDSFCHKNSLVGKSERKSNIPSSVFFSGGGALFHHIPEQPEKDPYVRTATSLVAPAGGTLVWSQSHLHTGGVNATLYRNGKVLCSTTAIYGTDPDPSTNARNERGHLVAVTSCYDQIGPEGVRFDKGDVFTTESYYYGATNDPNLGPITGGEHKNVMSMFFLGVVLEGTAEYITENRTSFNLWNDFVPLAGVGTTRPTTKTKHLR